MNKHAYLIIAHNEYDLLKNLVKKMNYDKHDFYILIDKKVDEADFFSIKKDIQNSPGLVSRVEFINRINVNWGTYSQIEAELNLFESSFDNNETYSYYHLISGVDIPLNTAEDIYNYFEKKYPTEFVTFSEKNDLSDSNISRIKYYAAPEFVSKIHRGAYSFITRHIYHPVQKFFKIDRLKNKTLQIGKGSNWVSLTDKFISHIVTQRDAIEVLFRATYCADEIFVQTLLLNWSGFNEEELDSNQRYTDWERGLPYTFEDIDLDLLINLKKRYMFARKFSTKNSTKIIGYFYSSTK